MSRVFSLRFPTEAHRDNILDFLASHPRGDAIRKAIMTLKSNPRPEDLGYTEIDPDREVALLIARIGIPWDEDMDTVFKRCAPNSRIAIAGCEVVYQIDDNAGEPVLFLFDIRPLWSERA